MGCMGTTALMTFRRLRAASRDAGKQELIDGELIIMPPSELKHTEIGDDNYFVGAPMIAVEVLSPGEEIRKLTLYFSEGALEVWVVDAKRKAMTVYARREQDIVRLTVEKAYRFNAADVLVTLPELFEEVDNNPAG